MGSIFNCNKSYLNSNIHKNHFFLMKNIVVVVKHLQQIDCFNQNNSSLPPSQAAPTADEQREHSVMDSIKILCATPNRPNYFISFGSLDSSLCRQ